ncbi:uncharacterized protein LOC128642803 [Bombina bombina]|uniref:uncharacterized protein LOC128642803 n=1 Tax=Bombina bombina TaxID=8345 RepID=UPI00235AA0D0|nr:uncharacterized protein LOC128642803 [Bombina bombina]
MATAQCPLQNKYKVLAANLSHILPMSAWESLKSMWFDVLTPAERQSPNISIVRLLDITNLKEQLKCMGHMEGVQLCQKYENNVIQHLQDDVVTQRTCSCRKLSPEEIDELHSTEIPLTSPVQNSSPQENDEDISFTKQFTQDCAITGQTKAQDLDSKSPTQLYKEEESNSKSTACFNSLPYNTYQEMNTVNNEQIPKTQNVLQQKMPQPDSSTTMAEDMLPSDYGKPLRSYYTPESSVFQLQISTTMIQQSLDHPRPAALWSDEVVSGFTKLPDFSFDEAKALHPLLNTPEACNLLSVKQFLLQLQSQPGAKERLRGLTRLLKTLGRRDVVESMHEQRNLLHFLGPVLPERQLIRNMNFTLWFNFTTALSISESTGKDWMWLADKFEIPRHFVDLWHQKSKNPAKKVLQTWQVKVGEATIGRLFDLMMEMGREDLASML